MITAKEIIVLEQDLQVEIPVRRREATEARQNFWPLLQNKRQRHLHPPLQLGLDTPPTSDSQIQSPCLHYGLPSHCHQPSPPSPPSSPAPSAQHSHASQNPAWNASPTSTAPSHPTPTAPHPTTNNPTSGSTVCKKSGTETWYPRKTRSKPAATGVPTSTKNVCGPSP